MGMAASQARLLTITARLADNELRSQTINNAKMRLAAQSSQVSENYINALNNATLMFGNYDEAGNELSQVLTYNALTAYSSYNTQYGLVNSSGQILVSESEAAMFQNAHGNLNAYLKSHGLEYTTTYFEEMGNWENEAYPAPFNSIEYEEMQLYYEQYNSYENSLEVEEYEKNYSAYISASNNLIDGAEESMQSYLYNSGNSPAMGLNADKDFTTNISASTAADYLNKLKDAFLGANDKTYNLEKLQEKGFLSQTYSDLLAEQLLSYSLFNGTLPGTTTSATDALMTKSDLTDEVIKDEAAKTYTIDDFVITVDDSGNVTNCAPPAVSAEDTEDGISNTYPDFSAGYGSSLADFVNNYMYYNSTITDADGNSYTTYYKYQAGTKTNDDGTTSNTYSVQTIIPDNTIAIAELTETAETIMETIMTSANYENFADWILEQDINTLKTNYGIDPDATIGKTSNTLRDYLNEYTDAKDAFLDNIFSDEALTIEDASGNIQYVSGVDTNPPHNLIYTSTSGSSNLSSKDIVEEDLKNGYSFTNDEGETVVVTAENLTDIDFVLQYLKHRDLTQSESFNTVIKEFLVEQMISIYGEPKYAWVDENDLNNTGNADAKAQWYTNLFNRMMQGYKVLENGLASSSEWIEYALESGIVSLEQVDKSYNWDSLDYKTCTKITEETVNDEITKAEAEYNRAMKDIEAKDNIYDIELKNIDTEHSSLQTEYESIKSVISKNIERTFKFNQSA